MLLAYPWYRKYTWKNDKLTRVFLEKKAQTTYWFVDHMVAYWPDLASSTTASAMSLPAAPVSNRFRGSDRTKL